MEETLNNLGFINHSTDIRLGYYKSFKGFRLFISKDRTEEHWNAGIVTKETTIMIPLPVDKFWVYGFNVENGGIDYTED